MQPSSRCVICGSDAIEQGYHGRATRRVEARVWQVDRCRDCNHCFLNPVPDWADLATYYSSTYSPYQATHGLEASDVEIVRVAQAAGEFRHIRIERGRRLLDVGCGGGAFVRVMKQLGFDVQGVEPSDHGAATAVASGLPVFHGTVDQFANAESAQRGFDVITMNHVLEHVPDPVATLGVLKGMLRPGGYIWVAVPNGACRSARSLKWRWHSTDLPYHIHQFCESSIRTAGERAKLALHELKTYSLPKAVSASVSQYLRHRFLIPHRVSSLIAGERVGRAIGNRLDAQKRGEALLAMWKHP